MRRLSVRKRSPGSFEVGPAGIGPTVKVNARTRKAALQKGKARLRELGILETIRNLPRKGGEPE